MNTRVRHLALAAAWGATMLLGMPAAHAFFPMGEYNDNNVLFLQKWQLNDFDTNNDGDVTSDEGLPIVYEGGLSGFTKEEMVTLDESFQVWEDVESSYAAFRRGGIITDPVPSAGLGIDFLPTIFLQINADEVTDSEREIPDPPEAIVTEVVFPVLGVTIPVFVTDDTTVVVGPGESYTVSSGLMVDADIVLNSSVVRPAGGESPIPYESAVYGTWPEKLKAVMVHEIGHLLGLGHTPLNNLRFPEGVTTGGDIESGTDLVESAVVWMTGADGVGRYVGATPALYPFYGVTYESACGCFKPYSLDLAPDDVSGVSWLYPTRGQRNFFSIQQEARTHTRAGTGLPSLPIAGGHVVAWADVDNDPNTARVPLFSTLTGLFVPTADTEKLKRIGEFSLDYLWKQIEKPNGGGWFTADYTFTLNPLNQTGEDRQAPTGVEVSDVANIVGSVTEFLTGYPSEVFHEAGNIFDIENKDAGTPLLWDNTRNWVASADTGRALKKILPRKTFKKPMFGDPNDVCPLNIVSGDTGTNTGTDTGTGGTGQDTVNTGAGSEGEGEQTGEGEGEGESVKFLAFMPTGAGGSGSAALLGAIEDLRGFRDEVLLSSGLGTAMVGLYYEVAPMFARYLLANDFAYAQWKQCVGLFVWIKTHAMACGALLLTLWLGMRYLRRQRAGARRIAGLGLALLLLAPASAQALLANVSQSEWKPVMVDRAGAIVSGPVLSTTSRWAGSPKRIVTDVVMQVDQSVKGHLNVGSQVSFTILGGRLDGLMSQISEMPSFKVGETAVVYLSLDAKQGAALLGGLYGKVLVSRDAATDKAYVAADNAVTKKVLEETAKKLGLTGQEKTAAEGDASVEGEAQAAEAGKSAEPVRIPLDTYLKYIRSLVRERQTSE